MMRIHHVGVACADIEAGVRELRAIYDVVEVSEIVFDEHQNASVCLIRTNNGLDIELVSGEPIRGLLQKEISYYHLCYEVAEIAREIARLKRQGAVVVAEPKPARLFGGRRVAFLYTGVGLIELLEIAGT